ncbi:MAG: hypothetical protein NT086_22415 [Proteobacteria bacterium]|nr:hypothetical protein [Pseudomonadota bacterium]
MQFKNIKALLAWAFQIECSASIKISAYGEQTGAGFGVMSMEDQRYQAAMVLAKVGRLPAKDRNLVYGYFTGGQTFLMALAATDLLPGRWPLGFRVEVMKAWVHEGFELSDEAIGQKYDIPRRTIGDRFIAGCIRLDRALSKELAGLESQLLPLLEQQSEPCDFHPMSNKRLTEKPAKTRLHSIA